MSLWKLLIYKTNYEAHSFPNYKTF